MSSVWIALLIICAAGAFGGLINALVTDNGFFLPCEQHTNGTMIVRPGFLGNVLTGIAAAVASWGLYGSFGSIELFHPLPATTSFTLASVVGAMLIGIGGARWLTNEVDKRLLRAAAAEAAAAPASTNSAQQMVAASPANVLDIAQKLQQPSQQSA
jgi:hypothetical protein